MKPRRVVEMASLKFGLVSASMGVLTAFAMPLVHAQETGGAAAAQPEGGTVVKNKAPVAKELLKVRIPQPKQFTLSNGVTVYVLEDHRLPAVRFSLSVRAGELFEPKTGVADMTASMLTEGTQSRSYRQLAEETEGMGASLNASSGAENATLSVSGLSENTDALIAMMADVLLRPTFPSERLDRLKFQATAALRQQRTNPASLIANVSTRVFYGGTPYARPTPTAEQIAAVTPSDLSSFHAAYYRPNGAIMGVTGDVDMKTLKQKLETAFREWKPSGTTSELPQAEFKPKERTRIFLIDRPGSTQTTLQFGNLSVRRNDPDYIPLVVANRILGGGSAGRLFQNIREKKGYTYGAYSSLNAGLWPGVWGASANVRTPVTEPATREFFNEFNRLQDEPVSANDLERAKRSIIGSFALTLESPQGILARTLELVQNGLPLNYWETYPAKIQAVTAEDVQRVARKYLGKDRIQVIAVGERKQIEEGLKQFGTIEVVDPAKMSEIGSR
jgi:zinc protease